MTFTRLVPLLLCLACAAEKDDLDSGGDTADTGFIELPDRPEACDPEVRVDGTPVSELASPSPGDQWYVLMFCDDVLQMGTYVLQADPAALVSVDPAEPILTFVAAGTVDIEYRVGSDSTTFAVTITD